MDWLNWLDKEGKQLSIYGWNEEEDKDKLQKEIDNEKREDPMLYDHKTASWESWLEKNNAIETSHKEDEKKEEWDGKFSSSNTKDEVKDEDDKAVSEEESLEELTDGKLEEIEKLKSWELWLEKDALDGKQSPDGLPKSTIGGKKVLEEAEEVINRDTRGKKNEMYKSWLEKMQGAGDARFGNQHLTGLDQEPVNNEEDEANILPEKEEKTDDKREKHEETDDKPYKGLKAEKK